MREAGWEREAHPRRHRLSATSLCWGSMPGSRGVDPRGTPAWGLIMPVHTLVSHSTTHTRAHTRLLSLPLTHTPLSTHTCARARVDVHGHTRIRARRLAIDSPALMLMDACAYACTSIHIHRHQTQGDKAWRVGKGTGRYWQIAWRGLHNDSRVCNCTFMCMHKRAQASACARIRMQTYTRTHANIHKTQTNLHISAARTGGVLVVGVVSFRQLRSQVGAGWHAPALVCYQVVRHRGLLRKAGSSASAWACRAGV